MGSKGLLIRVDEIRRGKASCRAASPITHAKVLHSFVDIVSVGKSSYSAVKLSYLHMK